MVTINDIIKASLESLRKENLKLTPDNYVNTFCKIAKDNNVIVEDCMKVDNSLKKLSPVFQEESKRHKVENVDDLLKFLTAIINRSNLAEQQKVIQAYIMLSKRLLQALNMMPNKQIIELSQSSIKRLESNSGLQSVEAIREKWLDLISNYDDSYLKYYEKSGVHFNGDLKVFLDELVEQVKKTNQVINEEISPNVANLFIASLVPSIASSMNDDLAHISSLLKNNPNLLQERGFHEDVKDIIKKRIELDKAQLKENLNKFSALLTNINQRIVNLLATSEGHSKKVEQIKENLLKIDLKNSSFEEIQAQLLRITESLENETKSLTNHMQNDKNTITQLQDRIFKLENALVEAKRESKEDFLTCVATKRALQDQLEVVEENFLRYSIDYCVCFFDVDKFKDINDTYGHDAGDVILATLGKILKKYIRKTDFVGRYGGEEFLVILPNISYSHAIQFADKIRKIVDNFKFIYRKERIVVQISGGVAQRSLCSDLQTTVKRADKELYNAKKLGRNQISPQVSQLS